MLTAPASSLSEFADSYHLWSVIFLLCLMGIYHLAGLLIHWGFRLCGDAHEEYYNFKVRIVENKRRYEQLAGESARALSRGAGAS